MVSFNALLIKDKRGFYFWHLACLPKCDTRFKNRKSYATSYMNRTATLLLACALSAPAAFAITISHNPNHTFDNVHLNNGDSGTLIKGHFNGANAGYIVDLTSDSGNKSLKVQGNALEGDTGNTPYTQLNISLENNASFEFLELNVDPNLTLTGTFTVYFTGGVSPYVEDIQLDGNGENRYGILAGAGEKIKKVSLSISPALNQVSTRKVITPGLNDVKQIRFDGLADAVTSTPDGGSTALLAGLGALALAGVRKLRQ